MEHKEFITGTNEELELEKRGISPRDVFGSKDSSSLRKDIEQRLYETIKFANLVKSMNEYEINAEVDVLMRLIDDYKTTK